MSILDFGLIDLAQVIREIESNKYDTFELESLSEYSLPQLESFIEERMVLKGRNGRQKTAPKAALSAMAVQLKTLSIEFAEERSKLEETKGTKSPNHLHRFSLFQRLPLELRRMVWQHALPGPQILEVYQHGPHRSFKISKTLRVLLAPLLKACLESREVVKSRYRLQLAGVTSRPALSTIALDPLRDTLYVMQPAALDNIIGRPQSKCALSMELRESKSVAVTESDLR
jgi:hypothetical protein